MNHYTVRRTLVRSSYPHSQALPTKKGEWEKPENKTKLLLHEVRMSLVVKGLIHEVKMKSITVKHYETLVR